MFESDIGAKCNYMFAGKAEGTAVRPIDACLAGGANHVHKRLMQAFHGIYI
jgi:hypothetical protein